MSKKMVLLLEILLFISGFIFICSYNGFLYIPNEPPQVIADIAYDINDKYGYTVYIKETDEYVPYLVLTNNYNGNCLILRKYLLDEPMRYNNTHNKCPSYYENSEVDIYLNNDFIKTLSEAVSNKILDTELEITDPITILHRSGGEVTCIIKRKIFLLSATEVSTPGARCYVPEGKKIEYFNSLERKIALSEEGIASSWFLRTPNISSTCINLAVLYHGGTNSAGMQTIAGETEFYLRPAFCIPRSSVIYEKNVDGNIIYTLE